MLVYREKKDWEIAAAKLGSSQDAGQRQARHGMNDRKRIKDTVASRFDCRKEEMPQSTFFKINNC